MGSYICIGWLSLDLANIKFGLISPNSAMIIPNVDQCTFQDREENFNGSADRYMIGIVIFE